MFEANLKVSNLCWHDMTGQPFTGTMIDRHLAAQLSGRFAIAYRDRDRVVLARDKLGLNKLFFAFHPSRGVVAANYLIDLILAGNSLKGIYSVPAGSIVTIDLRLWTTAVDRFYTLPAISGSARLPEAVLSDVDCALTKGMQRLAASHQSAPVAICLSGGADSALIAIHARRHFPKMIAYTYQFGGHGPSQDSSAAQHVAHLLGIELRIVPAEPAAILHAVHPALTFGQDWRDFNVHAAIVNEILATAIASDHPKGPAPAPLVLTGDLMNELMGDYSPVPYAGVDHYPLPKIPPSRLRISLTRGIQTGDREVGIFGAHGLQVAQPYSWAFEPLLEMPNPIIKSRIIGALAGGELPPEVLGRPKVRAQIGDAQAQQGILPILLQSGRDGAWLQQQFCKTFSVDDPGELRRFMRAGVYRVPAQAD